MKRNKLLAVAFGIILILSVLPAVAGCKDNIGDTGAAAYTYSKLVYSVKNDGVHILGYNGQESSVIFPNTIEGREVVSVESVSSKTLVSITLPSSVKKIESKAFKNCLALENINILSEDIIIADDAFAYFEEKQTELRPQMMSTFTATAEDSDTDKKIIFVTFSVSSENVIEDNAILNDNNTIILNTAQKSLLQKFIDTGHLQKYRILRNSSADNSVLEVDGNYIYYDKKVNNQSVYTETFTGNMSYIVNGTQKLKKQSLPELVFENARIKMSDISISPNFRRLSVDEENNSAFFHDIYRDTEQTIEFYFGGNYIVSARETIIQNGVTLINDYTVEANPDITKKTVDEDGFILAENKTVEIMYDTNDSTIHYDGQKKFTVSYDSLLFRLNLWKENYRIVGFYTDSGFKKLWNFSTDKVTENIKLYIKFEECRQIVDDYECWIDDEYAYILSYLGDELDELHIPSTFKGLPVKQINFISPHIRRVYLPNIKYNFNNYYDANRELFIDDSNIYLTSENGAIFDKNKTTLLHVNPNTEIVCVPTSVTKFGEFFQYWGNKVYFFESEELPASAEFLNSAPEEYNLHYVLDYLNSTSDNIIIIDGVTYRLYGNAVTAVLLGDSAETVIKDYVEFNGVPYPVTNFRTSGRYDGEKFIVKLPATIDLSQNDFWKNNYTPIDIFYIETSKPADADNYINRNVVVWDSDINDTDEEGNSYAVNNDILYCIRDGKAKAVKARFYLLDVEIPAEVKGVPVTEIADECFYHSYMTDFSIPDSVYIMGRNCLPSRYIDSLANGYIYFNKVLYQYKGTKPENFIVRAGTKGISANLYSYSSATIKTLSRPDSLLYIGDSAFADQAFGVSLALTELTIPESVEYIGKRAFSSTNTTLEYVLMGGNLRYVGENAFFGNKNIYKIHVKQADTSTWHQNWNKRINDNGGLSLEPIRHDVCTHCHCDRFGQHAEITDVTIVISPDKTIYTVGEIFNPAGMKVAARYGASTVYYEEGFRFDAVPLSLGQSNVSCYIDGYRFLVNITVFEEEPEDKLEVECQPFKTRYIEGDVFDPEGMRVIVRRPEGTSYEVVDYTYTTQVLVCQSDNQSNNEIIIGYNGMTVSLWVTVRAVGFKSIIGALDEMRLESVYRDVVFEEVMYYYTDFELMEFPEKLQLLGLSYNNSVRNVLKVGLIEDWEAPYAEYPCYIELKDYSQKEEILNYINGKLNNRYQLNKYGDIVLKDFDITDELFFSY